MTFKSYLETTDWHIYHFRGITGMTNGGMDEPHEFDEQHTSGRKGYPGDKNDQYNENYEGFGTVANKSTEI